MARPKREVIRDDATGFAFRPGQNNGLYQPEGALGKRKNRKAEASSETSVEKIENSVTSDESLEKRESSKEQKTNQPQTENSVTAIQTRVGLDPNHDAFQEIERLGVNHGVPKTHTEKVIAKSIIETAKKQSSSRSATPIEKVSGRGIRLQVEIPDEYIEKFRTQYDKLEVIPLAEVARSWLQPTLEDALLSALAEIRSKLG